MFPSALYCRGQQRTAQAQGAQHKNADRIAKATIAYPEKD
jgi:hypothetical protein